MTIARLLAVFVFVIISAEVSATRILSLNPQGDPVGFGARVLDVSGNGRYAVLRAEALIAGAPNTVQIYVYDLLTDEVEMISVRPDGQASANAVADYDSPHSRVISSDGRYVLFQSVATDLVPAVETNGQQQIYRRDRQLGITEIMSVAGDRVTAANNVVYEYTMDCTGQQIVFRTLANNLTPEASGGTFLHQADAPPNSGVVTRKACRDVFGDFISCQNFSIGNGLLAFTSGSPNVSPDDPPGNDIFVGNVIAGNNILVTKDVGDIATSRSHSPPAGDCSGHRIAFTSNINIFFNPDGTFVRDLYAVDTVSGQKIRFGFPDAAGATLVNTTNRRATISDNGRLIGFTTDINIDPRDTNSSPRDSYFIELSSSFASYEFIYVGHWNDVPSDRNSFAPHLGDNGIAAFVSDSTDPAWPVTNGFGHAFANLPPNDFGIIFQGNFQQTP